MAEQLTLTSNEVVPQITTRFYRVVRLLLDWDAEQIIVTVRGENGEIKSFNYEGDTAKAMMIALNKANLSTKSLQARVLERLSQDGKLVGSVTGTPD